MFLFGGVFFPFYGPARRGPRSIGWCLPLSHLVAATRDLTLGGAGWVTLAHVAFLLAVLVRCSRSRPRGCAGPCCAEPRAPARSRRPP